MHIRRLICTCSLFLLLLCAKQTHSQESASLSAAGNPAEKVFVHVAKDFYLPGEIIWFKLFVTETASHAPSFISKVGYAELLDSSHKAVLQVKIAVDSGSGGGSMVIPSYLSSGNYVLRAYTNLLKNYDARWYFHSTISVLNTSKPPAPISQNPVRHHAGFFPEGGDLVAGLSNTVAFKLENVYGKSITGNGKIVNQQNETIATFSSRRFGMGRFNFIPQAGNTYKAIVNFEDRTTATYDLPAISSQGYTMQLTEQGDQLKIVVQSGADASAVHLLIHTAAETKTVSSQQLANKQTSFTVAKNELAEGITYFTVFNQQKQAVSERLYFKRPKAGLEIDITANNTDYKTRSKISASISTNRSNGEPALTDLSMSVFLLDSLQTAEPAAIRNYLWLGSELRGNIEAADFYFSSNDADAAETTDNLMLTQGWRKLLPQQTAQSIKYIPEFAGHIITGRVTDRRTGQPAKDIIVYLSVPGDRFHFSSCASDANGRVRFDIKKIFGTENIIVQTNKETDSSYRVDIDIPFSEKFETLSIPDLFLPESYKNSLLTRLTAAQVQNAYVKKENQLYYLPNFSDTTAFFGKPDNSYLLDDYTRFTTMEEVMREYVPEVQLRRAQGGYRYRMLNQPYKVYFENNPLVLLDGVPVFDINRIVAFDPLKVKRLDIVARKYFQGAVAYDGIASYSTYQGDLGGFALAANSLLIEYPGLQLQRQFYSPVYETAGQRESRIPDFRNLLYWSPDIKTNAGGKEQVNFYSSDLPGRYAVIVQGIAQDGSVGSAVRVITVNGQ